METINTMLEILWIMKWHVAALAVLCFVAPAIARKAGA